MSSKARPASSFVRSDLPSTCRRQCRIRRRVAIVKVGLGDDDRLLAAIPGLGYRGLVIEAMGAGHLPAGLVAAAEKVASEIPVVLATRVAGGPIFRKTYGFPGAEIDLIARGLIPAGLLSSIKARLLLALLVGRGHTARPDRTRLFRLSTRRTSS